MEYLIVFKSAGSDGLDAVGQFHSDPIDFYVVAVKVLESLGFDEEKTPPGVRRAASPRFECFLSLQSS